MRVVANSFPFFRSASCVRAIGAAPMPHLGYAAPSPIPAHSSFCPSKRVLHATRGYSCLCVFVVINELELEAMHLKLGAHDFKRLRERRVEALATLTFGLRITRRVDNLP